MIYIFFNLIIFLTTLINAKIVDDINPEPLKIGNFALATSQQPGPLYGFGQNFLDKGELQFSLYEDYQKIVSQEQYDTMPGFLYGITDDLSVYFNLPLDYYKNMGIEDSVYVSAAAQLEYAFFSKSTYEWAFQSSFLIAMAGPSGSMVRQAKSHQKTTNFFVGATSNYMSFDWYYFCSFGELFFIYDKTGNGIKKGDNFLYQAGIGVNIKRLDNYIFMFMTELLGTYIARTTINGEYDNQSGGNLIFLAPSLWFSSDHITLQFGISIPLYQGQYVYKNKSYKYQIGFDGSIKF